VRHDHAAAAVALQAELVHGISAPVVSTQIPQYPRRRALPISLPRVRDELQVPLPQVAGDLPPPLANAASPERTESPSARQRTFPQEKQRIGIIILVM
jgi:hypothetical protein